MLNVDDLKKYIVQNEKVEYILESLKCHHIQRHTLFVSCGHPDGDNPRSIVIYDNLNVNQYTHEKSSGDIINLVQGIRKCDFQTATNWICSLLHIANIEVTQENNKVFNPSDYFESFRKSRHNNVNSLVFYNNDILDDYEDCVYIDFAKDICLTETVRKKFNLKYDNHKKCTIIPENYWKDGSIIGVTGRSSNGSCDILGIAKYYAVYQYKKTLNLYGLYQNYEHIKQAGYVVVAESQKSVLKRCSLLDNTVVAAECHSLSDEQVKILLGLDVEIIIAWDKDVELEHFMKTCENFYNIRKVSFIYDTDNILDEKQSPMDLNNDGYLNMLNDRMIYNSKCHNKFLEGKRK